MKRIATPHPFHKVLCQRAADAAAAGAVTGITGMALARISARSGLCADCAREGCCAMRAAVAGARACGAAEQRDRRALSAAG